MTPTEAASRLVGLLVALAGAALAWGGLFAPIAGTRGVDLLARGAVVNPPVLVGAVGVALVLAGLAVLLDRGRPLAVSVGGLVLVAVVALLVIGAGATPEVVGLGAVAVAALLAGASIGVRPT
ncbi:MAG: hypothetical protein ABEJ97_01135 [Halobellus sp.]